MRWIGCLFCFVFPTFSLQTSRARPHRSEEWSGAVEAVLQRRGKKGVEVGSIHIRFELSPHFAGLRGKQLLLTLMLDIPKHKKSLCSAATKDMEVIISVRFQFTKSLVSMFLASLPCIYHVLTKHSAACAHQVVKAVPFSQVELTPWKYSPTSLKVWYRHYVALFFSGWFILQVNVWLRPGLRSQTCAAWSTMSSCLTAFLWWFLLLLHCFPPFPSSFGDKLIVTWYQVELHIV